jgi:hypothetical protein
MSAVEEETRLTLEGIAKVGELLKDRDFTLSFEVKK